jgi:hypothetical protein
VGERLVLSFAVPHGGELTVFAEVTRATRRGRHGGMGLEFVDIRQSERVALHRALRDLYRDAHAKFLMRCAARAS